MAGYEPALAKPPQDAWRPYLRVRRYWRHMRLQERINPTPKWEKNVALRKQQRLSACALLKMGWSREEVARVRG